MIRYFPVVPMTIFGGSRRIAIYVIPLSKLFCNTVEGGVSLTNT